MAGTHPHQNGHLPVSQPLSISTHTPSLDGSIAAAASNAASSKKKKKKAAKRAAAAAAEGSHPLPPPGSFPASYPPSAHDATSYDSLGTNAHSLAGVHAIEGGLDEYDEDEDLPQLETPTSLPANFPYPPGGYPTGVAAAATLNGAFGSVGGVMSGLDYSASGLSPSAHNDLVQTASELYRESVWRRLIRRVSGICLVFLSRLPFCRKRAPRLFYSFSFVLSCVSFFVLVFPHP